MDVQSQDVERQRAETNWVKEYEVDDEQVDTLRVLDDGALWISAIAARFPGHDSHVTGRDPAWSKVHNPVNVGKDWLLGNVYRHEGGGRWSKQRTIPNGIHTYDLIEFKGTLFAACSTVAGGVVARSADGGLSWHESITSGGPWQRTRSLFVLGGHLYAATSKGRVYRYDGAKKFEHLDVNLFPAMKAKDEKDVWAERPVPFAGQVVYIGAHKIYDHDWRPLGLYSASAAQDKKHPLHPAALALPEGALPRDVLVGKDDRLYVLASTVSGKNVVSHVFSTKDVKSWKEELRFSKATFARSFDRLGGDYYFGLGSDPDHLSDETGTILRYSPGSQP